MIALCKKIVSFFATILFLLRKIPQAVCGKRDDALQLSIQYDGSL